MHKAKEPHSRRERKPKGVPSGEVCTAFEQSAMPKMERKGHRIRKRNRRRTLVRRECKFADSKRHSNQNLCQQIFTLKNERHENYPMPFAFYVLLFHFLESENFDAHDVTKFNNLVI